MISNDVACPSCGRAVNLSDEEQRAPRIRVECQGCETVFWITDHNPGKEALELDFRLARDTEESVIVI